MRRYSCVCALRAADFDGVRTLWAISDFECHCVTFLQVIELHANELIHVEEKILVFSLAGDETESLIREPSNSSLLHSC